MIKVKKRKNCQKGYSCGFTCISLSKACWKEFAEGIAVNLENRSLYLASSRLPEAKSAPKDLIKKSAPEPKVKANVKKTEEQFADELKSALEESRKEGRKLLGDKNDEMLDKVDEARDKFDQAYKADKELYGALDKITKLSPSLNELAYVYKKENNLPFTSDNPPYDKLIEHFEDRIGPELVGRFKEMVKDFAKAEGEYDEFERQYKDLMAGGQRVRDLKANYKVEQRKPKVKEGDVWNDKPHSGWRKSREKVAGAKRAKMVELYGEELVKRAEDRIRLLLDNSDLNVRVPPKVMDQIVGDSEGRLKTQFETGTSGGALGTSYRRSVERDSLGVSTNEDAIRPIYGYFSDRLSRAEYEDKAGQYGDVRIVFKDSVKERSTVTGDDSLNEYEPPYSITGSGLGDKFNIASLFKATEDGQGLPDRETLEKIANSVSIGDVLSGNGGLYLEAQIFGQPKVSEAAQIVYSNGTKPDSKVEEWARKNGIEIVMED
jgi:hypothetical protein